MGMIDARNLITSLIDSTEAQMNEHAWTLEKGSAHGYVYLVENDKNSADSTVYISFRIMNVPLKKEMAFYRRLLEINNTMGGRSSFSVDNEDRVWLNSGRSIIDLDKTELSDLITYTAGAADYYDDVLLDEFGREYAAED